MFVICVSFSAVVAGKFYWFSCCFSSSLPSQLWDCFVVEVTTLKMLCATQQHYKVKPLFGLQLQGVIWNW